MKLENSFKYAEDMETHRYLKIIQDRQEKSQPIKKENIKVVDTDIILEFLQDSCLNDLVQKQVNRELFEDVVMSAMSHIGSSEYIYLKTWNIQNILCNTGNQVCSTTFAIEGTAITSNNDQVAVLVENIDIEDKYTKPKIKIKYNNTLDSFGSFLDDFMTKD